MTDLHQPSPPDGLHSLGGAANRASRFRESPSGDGWAGWSLRLGRCQGWEIRVHFFFLLLAAAGVTIAWPTSAAGGPATSTLLAICGTPSMVLLISVFVHEWGHAWVARRLGVECSTLVLGPLGGLTDWTAVCTAAANNSRAWRRRRPHVAGGHCLAIACAGICSNLGLAGVCLLGLTAVGSRVGVTQLLNPLVPYWQGVPGSWLADSLAVGFWMNWVLVLVNMLPASPFDGGLAWPALVCRWRGQGHPAHLLLVRSRLAWLTAFGLFSLAIFSWRGHLDSPHPPSMALLLLATVIVVSRRRAPGEHAASPAARRWRGVASPRRVASNTRCKSGFDGNVGDRAQAASGPSAAPAGCVTDAEVERDLPDDRDRLAEIDQTVDEILTELHALGWGGLTTVQRSILQQASRAYRKRLERRRRASRQARHL